MTAFDQGEFADFCVHRMGVEPYLGTLGSGVTSYGASQPVVGYLSRKRRLVRDTNGNEVVSESLFIADPSWASIITARAKLTLLAVKNAAGAWVATTGEQPATVISTTVAESGPLGLPDHVSAALQ